VLQFRTVREDPDHCIWIDDRNAIFRRGLRSLLTERGFTVAGESARLEPEPELAGVAVLLFELDVLPELLRRTLPETLRLVGIAASESAEALLEALEVGLSGFLVRSELSPESLACCLEAVVGGASAVPPQLLTSLLRELARGRRPGTTGDLSKREIDVLRLLAGGDDTRAIATNLSYSERTVKNIIHDVLVKLDCRTRAHAVALATRRGVI
jgi:DNA-binding NarL/FixJ family response regulator